MYSIEKLKGGRNAVGGLHRTCLLALDFPMTSLSDERSAPHKVGFVISLSRQ